MELDVRAVDAVLTLSHCLNLDQIKSPFDAQHPLVETIQAPIDAGQAFLDAGHADLDILRVILDAVELFVDPAKIAQRHVVGLVNGHQLSSHDVLHDAKKKRLGAILRRQAAAQHVAADDYSPP